MSDSDSTSAWVTVAEAATKAQVDSGTVRQWYRSGRIPTRRAEGERGAFLVPLDLVLELAQPSEPPAAASIEAAQLGVPTGPSPAEVEALQRDLDQAREQVAFLRTQLAEVADENRQLKQQLVEADDQRADIRARLADAVDDRKGVEARLATVEAELTQLRRTAARASITDPSWLDQQTPAYESPVRRQGMAPTPTAPDGGPTAPFAEPHTNDLADLLAATRPDSEAPAAAAPGGRFEEDGFEDEDSSARARAIWTDEAPHPPLGQHDDDLLPEPDRKGRFGKK